MRDVSVDGGRLLPRYDFRVGNCVLVCTIKIPRVPLVAAFPRTDLSRFYKYTMIRHRIFFVIIFCEIYIFLMFAAIVK